jgi:hypothetical protein
VGANVSDYFNSIGDITTPFITRSGFLMLNGKQTGNAKTLINNKCIEFYHQS